MAAPIYIHWRDKSGIAIITHAMQAIEGQRAQAALRRAINHTGNKAFTRTRREISRVSSVPQKVLTQGDGKHGPRLTKRPASGGSLEYVITGSGKAIRIKHYSPRRMAKGYRFTIWQQHKHFKSAFWIGKGAKWAAGHLKDGNFYVRVGKARFPVHAMWGATVSKEIIKAEVVLAFERVVSADLPKRVMHEINWVTRGAFS
ncbi:MAG: Aurantimonas phage AmM [Pseudomonadota bacterium]|jgi:hypothetical protein